jgi:cytochrome P450
MRPCIITRTVTSGRFWSVSTYKPIVHVEALPELFSSQPTITLADPIEGDPRMPMFIAMDRPKHTDQRRTVAPAFTPSEIQRMAVDVRRRTQELLDELPKAPLSDWATGSRSSSPPRCSPSCSTSVGRAAQADFLVRLGGRY